ncbi:MAG TPA: hypothetical protein VFF67_04265 [Thermoplasmata archaeon]|nr:hypothetical protein [Thermoplasmata archaeon]
MAAVQARGREYAMHETVLEVLRRLNQAAERRSEVDGMELIELEQRLRDFWAFRAGETNLNRALRLLVDHGLVSQIDRPQYAWDRGRVLRERYSITTRGKAFLVHQIEETGRIR